MTAHAQALLIQAIALFLANTVPDGGRLLNGCLLSCVLFWLSVTLLFWWHQGQVTRFDWVFLRWGSLVFLTVGAMVLAPLFEALMKWVLPPVILY
jgi:hypothetical protein